MSIRPVQLMLMFFGVNAAAIAIAISIIVPSGAQDLKLESVNVQQPKANSSTFVSGKPSRFVVTGADIDVEIDEGTYDPASGNWTLSDNKAHYALVTPAPNNERGNTFIYGHNKKGLFNTLEKTTIDSLASVYTENGKEFIYRLKNIRDVSPEDVSLFEYKGPPILTVQTCSGSWYEKRRLFVFELVEVK